MDELEQLKALVERQGKAIESLTRSAEELTRRHVVYNAAITCLLLTNPHPERLARAFETAMDESRELARGAGDAEIVELDNMAKPFRETVTEAQKGLSAMDAYSSLTSAVMALAGAVCMVLPEARRDAVTQELAGQAETGFQQATDRQERNAASLIAAMREVIDGNMGRAAKILETQQPLR